LTVILGVVIKDPIFRVPALLETNTALVLITALEPFKLIDVELIVVCPAVIVPLVVKFCVDSIVVTFSSDINYILISIIYFGFTIFTKQFLNL